MKPLHQPVLVQEIMTYLAPSPGKKYLDATLGLGGHALALLSAGAEVVGIDRDSKALELASHLINEAGYRDRFRALHGSFAAVLTDSTLGEGYHGALFDLGVSSYQLDTPNRGFSFRNEAPLDMRMDPSTQTVTAADLVNGLGRKELYVLFKNLGQVGNSRRLVDALCRTRRLAPIRTTTQLARLVESLFPRTGKLHPATQVFQALRMAVNSEREELKAALPSALSRLNSHGVLAVISFHSGEDRLVKTQFSAWEKEGITSSLTASPLTPSPQELAANPRSRSAKLRVNRRLQ